MRYVELDPELAWKSIEGYPNELAGEQRALDAFYRQFRCPRCGAKCRKEYDPRHAFADEATLVPRALLRCLSCDCLFDPHTGVRVELGQPAGPVIDPRR